MKSVQKAAQYVKIEKKKFIFFTSFGVSLILFFVLGFLYQRYIVKQIDTSLNGSEIKEIHQNSIPADVKKRMSQNTSATISASLRLPILMYHYVEYVQDKNDKTRVSLDTLPTTLDAQVQTLKNAGYTFLTMSEVADVLDGKIKLASPSVALTFDDGYQDFYTDAYPILKKYNVKATNYVISGFLDHPNHLYTWQVREMSDSGIIEIGAHTVHHDWLKGKSLQEDTTETAQSKVVLEAITGKPVVSFAYPFGAFDAQSIDVIRGVGFRTATSTIPGIVQSNDNRYFLYRLRPGVRRGQDLLNWLNQSTFKPW